MKQPKKLTRNQKELLSKRGYDWTEWMYDMEDELAIRIIHKETKQPEWVAKKGK